MVRVYTILIFTLFIEGMAAQKLQSNPTNFNYPLGNIIQDKKHFATLNFNKDVDKQL